MGIESYIDSGFKRKIIIRFCLGLLTVSLTSSILFLLLMPNGSPGFYSSLISDFYQASAMLGPVLFLIGIFEIVVACLFTMLIVLSVSHTMGGPLYKLEQNLKKLKTRDLTTPPVFFRRTDQGKVLAEKFNEMLRNWHAAFAKLKHNFYELSVSMDVFQRSWLQEEKMRHDLDAVKKVRQHVKKMEDILDHFHTP